MKKLLFYSVCVLSLFFTSHATQAGVWISDAPHNGYHYQTTVFLQEEFLTGSTTSGSIGSLGWQSVGGVTTLVSLVPNHIGIIRRDTTATLNTLTSLQHYFNVATAWEVATEFRLVWIVRVNTVDANTQVRVGSAVSPSSQPLFNGAYFEKLDTDTNWFFVTVNNSVFSTRIDTGIPVNTDWTNFRIEKTPTSARGYINHALVATSTTNISSYGHAMVQIYNTAAASKTIDIDYCELTVNGLTR